MSIHRIVNLNSINAKNKFDFDYLISKNENLVDAKYKVDNNSIIFIFDAKEEQLLDRTSLTVYEKLIVLLNALDLYELNNYIDFSLSPSNLVFQEKLNVSILQRDVNYGQGNNFLIKWKSLLGALLINGCEYQALVDGGFSVLKSNGLTNKFVDLQEIDEIRIILDKVIIPKAKDLVKDAYGDALQHFGAEHDIHALMSKEEIYRRQGYTVEQIAQKVALDESRAELTKAIGSVPSISQDIKKINKYHQGNIRARDLVTRSYDYGSKRINEVKTFLNGKIEDGSMNIIKNYGKYVMW